ncbi:hypothetical protein CMO88_02450 [Candidatus Woesearchaeota archaeon]|nr:hypothetical protein [Candidatus Woesearchaeota archaeon]|tara:strand:+ start:9872 stop:10207 length:336 start_codon:yes stop_codon:yes gene_type:complete
MTEPIPTDVSPGQDFFAEQVSVSHSPVRFVVDFLRSTPRIDGSTQSTRLFMSHSIVMLDPYLAKEFLSVLADNIGKYEKKFGKIEKPTALKKFEKEAHKEGKKTKKQDYFG